MFSFRAIKLCAYLILGAIVLVTFIPCVGNDFINWDDLAFVVKNPYISSLSLKTLAWALTSFFQGVWHPLAWLSHAADLAVWGAEPSYHHLVSIFIHVVTVLLVAALFVKLQEARRLPRESVYIAAFTGALLFGVHPLRVESVAWVSERKDVLCALFTVASLVFYLDYAMASERPRRRRYYLTSLVCYLLAVLSKPMAITLPLVLLVLDFFPLERLTAGSIRRVLLEKAPFLVLAAGAAILNMAAAGDRGVPLSYVPLYMRTMNAFYAMVFYIKQSVFPQDLIPIYQMDRELDYFGPLFVLSAVLVIAATVACIWRAWNKDRIWAAVWFSYLIGLGPALGFFMSHRHAMADRYTYLPTLGLWLLVGLATARLWDIFGRMRRGGLAAQVGLLCCIAAVALAYGVHTQRQIGIWKNSEIFWQHILAHANYIPALAFYGLGKELERKGKVDEAFAYYEKARSLDPANPQFASEIANIIAKKGDFEAALAMFKDIAKSEPGNAQHPYNVGRMHVLLQRYGEAIPFLEKSLELESDHPGALLTLILAHVKQGDQARAFSYYQRYVSVGYPRRQELEDELGWVMGGKEKR